MSTCRFTPKERSGQMRLPSAWCGAGCDNDGVMAMEDLQKQFVTLATLEETEAHVISCYLNLAAGEHTYRSVLDERARLLAKRMPEGTRRPLDEALDELKVPSGQVWRTTQEVSPSLPVGVVAHFSRYSSFGCRSRTGMLLVRRQTSII